MLLSNDIFALSILSILGSFLALGYLGYPVILHLLAALQNLLSQVFKRQNLRRQNLGWVQANTSAQNAFSEGLAMTLLVPVFNEEKNIESKIKNTLALKTNHKYLEVIFVSDGSTDNTVPFLTAALNLQPNAFRIVQLTTNSGKYAAICEGTRAAAHSIVGVTDCSSILDPSAALEMLKIFSDETVGAASSHYKVRGTDALSTGLNHAEQKYFEYENKLKQLEHASGSLIVVQGAFYAFRKSLLAPAPFRVINDDIFIPCQVLRSGYKVAYCPQAVVHESNSTSEKAEFVKRARIAAGNLQCLLYHRALLNPLRFGNVSFKLMVHKVLRIFSPLLLAMSFVLNLGFAAFLPTPMISAFLALQVAFYALAASGFIINRKTHIKLGALGFPYFFVLCNVAVFIGIVQYVQKGASRIRWGAAVQSS